MSDEISPGLADVITHLANHIEELDRRTHETLKIVEIIVNRASLSDAERAEIQRLANEMHRSTAQADWRARSILARYGSAPRGS